MALTVNGCCGMSLRTAAKLQCVIPFLLFFIGFRGYFDYFIFTTDDSEKKAVIFDILIRNKYYMITYWVIAFLELFTTASLEVGIKENKDRMLLPSLIVRAFWIVVIIICSVLILIGTSGLEAAYIVLIAVVLLNIIGLLLWHWVVVYSLYIEIAECYYSNMERAYLNEI